MLNWDDARYFLAVYREGSLSAAARRLRVDQTTVGRRLAALERALGARLFDRGVDGAITTAAGEVLLAHAERMEQEAFAAQRELGGREERLAGTVRVTAPDVFGSVYLTPLLARLRRLHPDIVVELVADNRALSLSKREADVALRLSRPTQASLVIRQVAEVGTALYASQAYLDGRRARSVTSLSGHDLVGFDETFQPQAEVRWLARHARGARTVLYTNSTHAMLAAAVEGVGLAILPCYVAARAESLRMLWPPSRVVVRSLWLVVHKDLRHAARVRAFADLVTAALAADASTLRGTR